MSSKKREGLSKREYESKKTGKPMPYSRPAQLKALKEKIYKSGFDSKGKRIDFMNPKTKRGIITSID